MRKLMESVEQLFDNDEKESSATFDGRPIADIEVSGVNSNDYPDFADAFISHAIYTDTGEELTDDELDQLDPDGEWAYELASESFF